MRYYLLFFASLSTLYSFALASPASTAETSQALEPRRLEVLFLGDLAGSHESKKRFRMIRRAHGIKGINYTFAASPTVLNKEVLPKFDALLFYGEHKELSKPQETALLSFSENGGGCIFLHSASASFLNSAKFTALLGAKFKSNGEAVFRPQIVQADHPIMRGYKGFESWDETFVHDQHAKDKIVLQRRNDEPWTWVRNNGNGRVFYTASGHDQRVWQLDAYHDLIYRGLVWSVGDAKRQMLENLKLPTLAYEKSPVNIIQGKRWKDDPTPRRNDGKKIPDTHFQKSLTPEDSLKLVQVPVDMNIELFASEPMIVNPIAIAWDKTGRLWATEAYDYPNSFVMNKPGLDKIVILEDTDSDGKADVRKVFASGLTISTSVLPIDNGCITTDENEMVYLEDTDGDDIADKRTVIFKGIRIWDTHACVSNIRLGLDGWIYATVGYAGLDVSIGEQRHKHGKGVFRFTRDGKKFQWIQGTSNNTWGLGFTEDGRVMGSTANSNPSWYVSTPDHIISAAGMKKGPTPRADKETLIYPITFDHLQVDQKDRFTAAAGHTIYTAKLFGPNWRNKRVLIAAPTGKLVSALTLSPEESGFQASHTENNIYASADAWSGPVAAELAPDGSIFIADWYNPIIQHNPYQDQVARGPGNAYVSKIRDKKHGRIYRISPKNANPSAMPKLDTMENQVAALSHPNMFWRLQAQEKIASGGDKVISKLRKLAKGNSVAKIHTIHSLGNLGEDVSSYFTSKTIQAGVNAAVLQYLPKTKANGLKVLKAVPTLSPHDQLAALIFVAEVPSSPELKAAMADFQKATAPTLIKDRNLKQIIDANFILHGLVENKKVKIARVPLSESAKRGKSQYQLICSHCHQPNGAGTPKVFPPLDGSDWLIRDPDHSIMVVLKGLSGKVKVSGNEYNGMMPAHSNLSDQQLADVINYTRNQFTHQLGDISKDRVADLRAQYEDKSSPFTQAEIFAHKSKPMFHFDFTKSLKSNDPKVKAEIKSSREASDFSIGPKGIDLTSNHGEGSVDVSKGGYLDLPNGIIKKAATSGIRHNLTIRTTFSVSENRQWSRVWDFGVSTKGEDKPWASKNGIMLTTNEGSSLRLSARFKGVDTSIDWKRLRKDAEYTVSAHFTRHAMHLFVNDQYVGTTNLPMDFDLTQISDLNNWLGRSQFNDPLFDGHIKSLSIFSH